MKVLSMMLLSVFLLAGNPSGLLSAQKTGEGIKEEAKEAGQKTKKVAKKTGKTIKKGTKKVVHEGAKATRKGAGAVEKKTDNYK